MEQNIYRSHENFKWGVQPALVILYQVSDEKLRFSSHFSKSPTRDHSPRHFKLSSPPPSSGIDSFCLLFFVLNKISAARVRIRLLGQELLLFYCFPRAFVLLMSIVFDQLCLLHQLRVVKRSAMFSAMLVVST